MNASKLSEKFSSTLQEHRLVDPGERLLVAVSGGADSMALLDLCLDAVEKLDFEVAVAHFDHALRAESSEDAMFVADVCKDLGVACHVERQNVDAWAVKQGMGIEAAARELRYAFLERCANKEGCRRVALGHHRQDQAETVLHRLVRGSGLSGLAAMRYVRGRYVRPLLDFDREDLRAYVEQQQIEFREDQSNADVSMTRNFLRHQVMPRLRQINPAVDQSLARLAQTADLDNDYWQCRLQLLANSLSHERGGWSIPQLMELHRAEIRRFLVMVLEEWVDRQLEFDHVLAVEGLLSSSRPQCELDLPGVKVVRRYDRFEIRPTLDDVDMSWEIELPGRGEYLLPSGGEVVVSEVEGYEKEDQWSLCLPLENVQFPLYLRTFRPGDRMTLEAGGGRKKIKKIFAEAKLEREARTSIPQLVMGDEILWIPGLRRSGRFRCEDVQCRVLKVSIKYPENIESLLVKSSSLC